MRVRTFLIATASGAALIGSAAHAQQQTATPQSQPQSATSAQAQAQGNTASADENVVVITGYRASLEQSIATKRRANAIIDSVSAEDVGKFPNTNVAEALTLVPGVTVDRQFGQGEKVSILGTDPALNRTLLNGQTVASADWFILDSPGRTFNYALLAPQLVNHVDVYKSPEPRIDEGSIGGTVNVVTRKPLDLKGTTLAASLGYLYTDRSKKGDVQGSALVGWRNDAKTFGVLASVQRAKDHLRRDGLESYGTVTADFWAGKNDGGISSIATGNCVGACAATLAANPKAKAPNAFGTSYFDQSRERLTYSAAAQWKPVDKLTLSADWLRIDATYDNLNQSLFAFGGNVWNSAGSLTDLTVSNGVVTKASFKNALSVLDAQYRVADLHSQTFHGQAQWKDAGWDLSVEAGTSKADGGTKRQVYLEFLNASDYTVDISGADGKPGSISYPANVLGNPAAFVADPGWSGNLVDKPTTDREKYAQADLGFVFDGPVKRIQIGYKYRRHETAQGYAGISLTGIAVPASSFASKIAPGNYLSGFNGVNDQMRRRFILNGKSMVDYVAGRPNLPTPSMFAAPEFAAGNWDIKEDIHGGYAQVDVDSGNGLRGNFGVRYVDTTSDIGGYVCKPGASCAQEADWALQRTKPHYRNVLPSVNLIADLRRDLVFRFAAAEVIARPNYADMSNYFWLSDQILTGAGGNPDLKPYRSGNLNASLEWYMAPRSILSGEVFYKKISNYILQRTAPEVHYNTTLKRSSVYQISRPVNAGSAEVRGFAVAWQQSLPYGFGVLANYTYSDAKADSGDDLPFNSRHQASFSPFYESGPVSLRGTYSWRSKYFTGVDRGDQMYVRASGNLDASLTYNFTKQVGMTLAGMNLTDSEYYAYAGTKALPRGVYRSGRKFMATLNVNF